MNFAAAAMALELWPDLKDPTNDCEFYETSNDIAKSKPTLAFNLFHVSSLRESPNLRLSSKH